MERPYILHMFTPGRQMSPFDVNMAADAGYQIITPYCGIGIDAITGLTQDAIFSRGPKGVARTGIFIGGRDVLLAADMLERAKQAMVPPFVVSLFADPSGSYTTAAAMRSRVKHNKPPTSSNSRWRFDKLYFAVNCVPFVALRTVIVLHASFDSAA